MTVISVLLDHQDGLTADIAAPLAHHVKSCRTRPFTHRRAGTVSTEQFWLSIGFLGQAFFSMRIIIQWLASERRKESVIPVAFWLFSIGGGVTLFAYALHRRDPVFMIGEAIGTMIYLRNLYLIWRKYRGVVGADF